MTTQPQPSHAAPPPRIHAATSDTELRLRNGIEQTVRAWHAYETARGGAPVIDYDFHPPSGTPAPEPADRATVLERLTALEREIGAYELPWLQRRVRADLAYVRARLGERLPLDHYVAATQGCAATGWAPEYIDARRDAVVERLDRMGIGWDARTDELLRMVEQPVAREDAPDVIRAAARELEPAVRKATGAQAPFDLSIEQVDIDAYWSYWLDGAGRSVRLRLNLRNARFSQVGARQFALHEVLGHGLQAASFAARCATDEVPWVRVLSVHGPTQVLLEGLAQALPLFVCPDDDTLVTRVRLDHYLQLARAELHVMVNAGTPVEDCVAHARARVPFWTDAFIGDLLTDRATNPLLRSYLWSYPAGFDWFATLAEAGGGTADDVLHAVYRDPLPPEELEALWPDGPLIGVGGPWPGRGAPSPSQSTR